MGGDNSGWCFAKWIIAIYLKLNIIDKAKLPMRDVLSTTIPHLT
jgi:hypothetical protein